MKKEKKKLLTPFKRALVAAMSIVAAVLFILVAIRLGEIIAFARFYAHSQRQFDMPGTSSGFVGQGLDYDEEHKSFISCGYSAKKGETSSVYITGEDGKSRGVLLKNKDGSNYTGHTGGVAHYKEYFYITGNDGCAVFLLDDLYSGATQTKMIGSVTTAPADDHDPAYCNLHDGKFYVGSFYRASNYETAPWQRMTTPAGDENTAAIKVFDIDDSAKDNFYIGGLNCVYSTVGLVQGMTFNEDTIILSTSYGLAKSHLIFYDTKKIKSAQGGIDIDGKNVPLYFLDSGCRIDTVVAPPMSEEIVYLDGKIYIMCESASNKYIFGKLMSGRYLFAYKCHNK